VAQDVGRCRPPFDDRSTIERGEIGSSVVGLLVRLGRDADFPHAPLGIGRIDALPPALSGRTRGAHTRIDGRFRTLPRSGRGRPGAWPVSHHAHDNGAIVPLTGAKSLVFAPE
jgi:hypothetical protein